MSATSKCQQVAKPQERRSIRQGGSTVKLRLLSMAASQSPTAETEADTAPQSSGSLNKARLSSLLKGVEMTIEEMKKARRREQCRINQANFRKRQRKLAPVESLRLSTSLNAEQKAALAMAIGSFGPSTDSSAKDLQHRWETRLSRTALATDLITKSHRSKTEESRASQGADLPSDEPRLKKQRKQCHINYANDFIRQHENASPTRAHIAVSKVAANSSSTAATELDTDDVENVWREKDWRINHTRSCRSDLAFNQAAVTKVAEQAILFVSSPGSTSNENEHKDVGDFSLEDKKDRRREQCRINKANYRMRKSLHEVLLMREIEVLGKEIKQLEGFKDQINQPKPLNKPLRDICDFYHALGAEAANQHLPDVQEYQRRYGCLPTLELLLDLQREEFDSVESLKLHWLWYRTQFQAFDFSMTSFERLEAGEHVILKTTGELRLSVYFDCEKRRSNTAGYGTIVCPVVQFFELEKRGQSIVRITCEVDFVGGVAIHGQSDPERTMNVLHYLSEGFYISSQK